MAERNICKFINTSVDENLWVHNFVYETEVKTMSKKVLLDKNRVLLVSMGKGQAFFDGQSIKFQAGDLFFGFEYENFNIIPVEKCEYMYIDFSGGRSNTFFKRFAIDKANRYFPSFDGLIPLWQDSLYRSSEKNLDLTAESMLLYTLSRLSVSFTANYSLINRIIDLTEEMFTSPELNITFLANELSYNVKYISHIFKEKMGVNYCEYLRNLRIKYAVSLLENGIEAVKNLAFLSGFSDPLYFSSVFKKVTGLSPREYKKKFFKNTDSKKTLP